MGRCVPDVLIGDVASAADFSQGTLPFWVLVGALLAPLVGYVPQRTD